MRLYSPNLLLLWSSLVTPCVKGFMDPLLRIRHMIPLPNIMPRENPQSNQVHVYEPPNINKKRTNCVVFFTGGNALITHEIYSNFLATLSAKQLSVHTIPFRYADADLKRLVETLKEEYADVVAASHSSGSAPLIEAVMQNPLITKVVMLDPIDARIDRTRKIRLKHLAELLIVKAEKSYEGEPMAFIPGFLELDQSKLKLPAECKVRVLDAEEYGHCDLLNPMYSNLIHRYLRTICNGTEDRSHDHLYAYIDWLTTEIAKFARGFHPPPETPPERSRRGPGPRSDPRP